MKTADEYKTMGDPIEIFKAMRDDWIGDVHKIGTDRTEQSYINLVIAAVHKGNRIWDEVCIFIPSMKPDGFKKIIKGYLLEGDMAEPMKRAAAYL
jgi:hypothetical protein